MNFMQLKMDKEYLDYYKNFKNFKEGEHKTFWDFCFDSLSNRDFVTYMVLCIDLNGIPPVKSFLLYHDFEISELVEDSDSKLDYYTRRLIGAFFGMLFQYRLGYNEDKTKSVRITMKDFNLSTAAVYL